MSLYTRHTCIFAIALLLCMCKISIAHLKLYFYLSRSPRVHAEHKSFPPAPLWKTDRDYLFMLINLEAVGVEVYSTCCRENIWMCLAFLAEKAFFKTSIWKFLWSKYPHSFENYATVQHVERGRAITITVQFFKFSTDY